MRLGLERAVGEHGQKPGKKASPPTPEAAARVLRSSGITAAKARGSLEWDWQGWELVQ